MLAAGSLFFYMHSFTVSQPAKAGRFGQQQTGPILSCALILGVL